MYRTLVYVKSFRRSSVSYKKKLTVIFIRTSRTAALRAAIRKPFGPPSESPVYTRENHHSKSSYWSVDKTSGNASDSWLTILALHIVSTRRMCYTTGSHRLPKLWQFWHQFLSMQPIVIIAITFMASILGRASPIVTGVTMIIPDIFGNFS